MFHYNGAMILLVFLVVFLGALGVRGTEGKAYCQPGDSCWPTEAEVKELYSALDPSVKRDLVWNGVPNPIPSSIPIYSPNNQPLYGFGSRGLLPLYAKDQEHFTGKCFLKSPERRAECLASVRNSPLNDWTPAFTVFPMDAPQISLAVQFATNHNLCVMVAGTGHDFLNRHSCNNGVFIRTTLIKGAVVNTKGDGGEDSITVGSGTTCSEAQAFAASQGLAVSCGWANTVGVAGWSIGGGHGPLAPSLGLGVDNLLGAEIVTADGNIQEVSSESNPDLYFALRGGGGSTWGVMAKLTLRAHKIPQGGYTFVSSHFYSKSGMCKEGKEDLAKFIRAYMKWSQSLDSLYSGLLFLTPSKSDLPGQCGGNWTAMPLYVYSGPDSDCNKTFVDFMKLVEGLPMALPEKHSFNNLFEFYDAKPVEFVIPIGTMGPKPGVYAGGVPSVLVSREHVANGNLEKLLNDGLNGCVENGACSRLELYHDITGQTNSVQASGTSISKGFREAMFHFVFGGDVTRTKSYYMLGNHSYFSESAYNQDGDTWKDRYWGDNYPRLLSIKNKWDKNGVFWCRHCVGDD